MALDAVPSVDVQPQFVNLSDIPWLADCVELILAHRLVLALLEPPLVDYPK